MLKKELAGVTMTHEEFMKEWCRLLRSTTKEEFGTAFAKWLERCEKCVRIGSIYVEKPKKLNALQSLIVQFLLTDSHSCWNPPRNPPNYV